MGIIDHLKSPSNSQGTSKMKTFQNISLFLAVAFLAVYAVKAFDDDFEEDRMVDDDDRMSELSDQEREAVDRFTEFMNALQRCGGSYYGGSYGGYNNYYQQQPYYPPPPPPPTTTAAPSNTTTAAYNPYLRPSGYRCYGNWQCQSGVCRRVYYWYGRCL